MNAASKLLNKDTDKPSPPHPLIPSFSTRLHLTKCIFSDYTGAKTGISLDGESASAAIDSGLAQFAAFGRPYIANPDLVARLQAGAPLNQVNPRTLYGGGAEGYTDYPVMDA